MSIKFEFEEERDAEFVLRLIGDAAEAWEGKMKTAMTKGNGDTNFVHVAGVLLLRSKMIREQLWDSFKKQQVGNDGQNLGGSLAG